MVKTMATVIERPGEAAFREVTLTPKREDTVVAKTMFSAISTGTDMKTYHGMQHPEQTMPATDAASAPVFYSIDNSTAEPLSQCAAFRPPGRSPGRPA